MVQTIVTYPTIFCKRQESFRYVRSHWFSQPIYFHTWQNHRFPFEDQGATTLQYPNTEHDMPLSKISLQVTVASSKNLDQKFQFTTTHSTPCFNVAPAYTFSLNQLCDAFKELRHIHFPEIAEGEIGAILGKHFWFYTSSWSHPGN